LRLVPCALCRFVFGFSLSTAFPAVYKKYVVDWLDNETYIQALGRCFVVDSNGIGHANG
jgi:hypothetical protein